MQGLFLNCSSSAPPKLERDDRSFFSKTSSRKKSLVFCLGCGNNGIEPRDLVDKGSLVLSTQNDQKGQTDNNNEIGVKDLVPFGGSKSTSSLEIFDEGIGIVKFLKGKSFLITGGTGFLAKVLIEKILRTTHDVDKIYLLIRAKNKEAAMGRLKNEIINTELFKRLQQSHGKSYQDFMLSKLVPVVGNVSDSDLGIENDLAETIAKEVDVIVNSAANTTFDERYDVSLSVNIKGPCHLMSFAKNCKKLKLFLHISTAYGNGQRQGKILERPFRFGETIAREDAQGFPLMLDIKNEMKLGLASMEDLDNNAVSQKMRELGLQRAQQHGWQDTYVFTKAMGEMMIDKMRGDVPLVIMRPSVIESTFKDPFPGWIEGLRMVDPLISSYGKGQLTGFLADPNAVFDVVPADTVVNATLAAMAKHGLVQKPDISVYQITSSVVNPLVYRDLFEFFYQHFKSFPLVDSKGEPIHVSSMKLFHLMEDFTAHIWADTAQRKGLTALADSSDTRLLQKLEFICRKTVEHTKHLANIYKPYTFYGGRFDNSNTQRLMESLSEEENMKFGLDVENIDWKDYITNVHIPGLRKHVMKGRGTSN